MGQGKVQVNTLNLGSGDFPEIERKALFIGVGDAKIGSIVSINGQTDFDKALGVNDSPIKLQVLTAMANGGDNWLCYAAPQNEGDDWRDALELALQRVSFELVVLCMPVNTQAEVRAVMAQAEVLRTLTARRLIFLVATPGINNTQTWSDYEAAQEAIQDSVLASRVCLVPLLHENDIGALAGRLCRHDITVADSPMRVQTGPMVGLGPTPTDSSGTPLSSATLATLDSNRISCIQTYTDYDGIFFGDANLLDAAGGDFQVIENMRIVDYAARRIRTIAIGLIADRKINRSPTSEAYTKDILARPLRQMSKSTIVAGIPFPGLIAEPNADAITLIWKTRKSVEIYFVIRPIESPKEITANIVLDLP